MKKRKNSIFPPINTAYNIWIKKFDSRFITKNEVIENTSENKIINGISNIYREYWRAELLKNNPENKTDTLLYKNLTNYLVSNHLTNLSQDSLSETIKNHTELKKLIEREGFKTRFLNRNGFEEVFIWDKETINWYNVILPEDTTNIKVVFIENYHLNGYDNFSTFGASQVGGWAIKESATLYCNKNQYDLNSENFMISYLKHETLHFTDLNKYPNLSFSDLEYRSKVIELMYCTEKTIHDIITGFIYEPDSVNRDYSHPYANYILIKNLSQLLFNSEYETDINKWKEIPVENINNAAFSLYKKSELILKKENNLNEVI